MDTVARNFQGGPAMRFLMTVNGGGAPPDEQLFAEMGRLVEELTRAGVLLATGGLDRRTHVTASGGRITLPAKRRAIDRIRRNERLGEKLSLLGAELEAGRQSVPSEFDAVLDDDENMGDDLLRLMFISCHPVLSTEARIALTLRLLGGLTTEEIARGFLVPDPTIAKRTLHATL